MELSLGTLKSQKAIENFREVMMRQTVTRSLRKARDTFLSVAPTMLLVCASTFFILEVITHEQWSADAALGFIVAYLIFRVEPTLRRIEKKLK